MTTHGPLRVSQRNPLYFSVIDPRTGTERGVYLTGSHIWNNFHDGMGPGAECSHDPEPFDFEGYLDFLVNHDHNLMRLWRWEHIVSQAGQGDFHLCMGPQPWQRTGGGRARDGRERFDLARLEPAYFERLRDRVSSAEARGVYVIVMLFEGWALHLSPTPDNIQGHPFHAGNNINGVDIESIADCQGWPLEEKIWQIELSYIRRVVDTLHDLPNVLWEVVNESSGLDASEVVLPGGHVIPTRIGDSTQWQYHVIDEVRHHERKSGHQPHPIGMSMQYPVPIQAQVNDVLFDSGADWIAPGFDDTVLGQEGAPPSRWLIDPPAVDQGKVVISDTDHFAPGSSDPLWPWRAFLRGHQPILMDFGLIGDVPAGSAPDTDQDPTSGAYEPVRRAMGDTRRYADRLDLLAVRPLGHLSSTGYLLADPGRSYLALVPSAEPLVLEVEHGTYALEWFDLATREVVHVDQAPLAGKETLTPPGGPAGAAVVLLVRDGR